MLFHSNVFTFAIYKTFIYDLHVYLYDSNGNNRPILSPSWKEKIFFVFRSGKNCAVHFQVKCLLCILSVNL